MTARVRVSPGAIGDAQVVLTGERAHHLRRVARARDGERVTLFDGEGRERDARVLRAGEGAVVLACDEAVREGVRRDRARVTWLQAIPKGDKLDAIARQATELGVERFIPVWTERAVPVERPDRARSRHERLARVIEEAARQCGRADIPALDPPRVLADALREAGRCGLRLIAWEGARGPLPALPEAAEGVAVLSGPEGGFARDEVLLAEREGFIAISLGPRILRAETVAPALLAVISSRWGDLAAGDPEGPR